MPPDPNPGQANEPPAVNPAPPPILQTPAPPVLASGSSAPPVGPPPSSAPSHNLIRGLLNVFVVFFVADAAVTFLDDLLTLLFRTHLLTGLSGIMFFLTFLAGLAVYLFMGLTPLVPKRFFLPLTLFFPVSILLTIPALIYFYGFTQRAGIIISTAQIFLGLVIVASLQRGLKFEGALVKESHLGRRAFSWLNLIGFGFVNLVILLPLLVSYLFLCASLAVHHFGEGFIELRPRGISVQVRKYVRNDGRTVELVPMSHIGETSFYHALSESFPTNALILMEGVTDEQNLLTNKISYKRMANSLGLAEQQREFKPTRVHIVRADVDISEFRRNTIGLLNLVMLMHSRGLSPENLVQLLTFSTPPDLQEQLFDDLLAKRNQHVVGELQKRLPDWDHVIIPWGAAHMPGISHEIEKLGFHVAERREFQAVAFHFLGRKRKAKAITNTPAAGYTSIPIIVGIGSVQIGFSTQEDLAACWGEGQVVIDR